MSAYNSIANVKVNCMRSILKTLFLLCPPAFVTAQFQHNQLDSMHMVLQHAANDTIRMDACSKFGAYYDDVNLDSSVYYSEKGVVIARQLHLNLNEAEMLTNMSWPLVKMGNYPRSLKVLTQALEIAGNPSNEKNTWQLLKDQTPRSYRVDLLGNVHAAFDYLYGYTGNYRKQINEAYEGIRLFESVKDTLLQAYTYTDIGNAYIKLNKLDSALYFEQKALTYYSAIPFKERKYETPSCWTSRGCWIECRRRFGCGRCRGAAGCGHLAQADQPTCAY